MPVDTLRVIPDAAVAAAAYGKIARPLSSQRFIVTSDRLPLGFRDLSPDSGRQRRFLTVAESKVSKPTPKIYTGSAPFLQTDEKEDTPPVVVLSEQERPQTPVPLRLKIHKNTKDTGDSGDEDHTLIVTNEISDSVPATLTDGGAGMDRGGPGKTARDFGPEEEPDNNSAWDIILENTRGKLSEDKKIAFFEPDHDLTNEQVESPTTSNELIAVPVATTPNVYYAPSAENQIEKYSVDLDVIQKQLLQLGFDEELAGSFAVVFQDSSDMNYMNVYTETPVAKYSSHGLLDTNETDNPIYYRMAFILSCQDNEKEINWNLWHEIGHAELDKIKGVEARNSWNGTPRIVKRTQKIGRVAGVSGVAIEVGSAIASTTVGQEIGVSAAFAGAALITAGIVMNSLPGTILHLLDPNERYANRIARQISHQRAIYIQN